MKEKIEQLILDHNFAKKELTHMLEELSQIDMSKLTAIDRREMECSQIALESEESLRGQFISSLEDLL